MSSTSVRPESRFIVGPLYDGLLFIWTPLVALGLGIAIAASRLNQVAWSPAEDAALVSDTLIGVMIHAHLFAVFFRSHGNDQIRELYPFRFFWVPPLLFGAMLSSQWVLISVSVLATFWDVYHSGLQTFGLGRIYDIKAGNGARVGRKLDMGLNHLLYAGPILGGATLLDHVEDLREFEDVGSTFFSAVPGYLDSQQSWLAWLLLVGGGAFVCAYVGCYYRWYRAGYNVSVPKVCLLVSTAICSIYSWGFNSWGEAFFIMNLFHAVQYFALVWAKEQTSLSRLFGRAGRSRRRALLIFLLASLGYGTLIEAPWSFFGLLYPLSLVVSIMHFWYDGFIWSVQKRQV